MKHNVNDLTGPLLDAAVALADGRLVVKDEPGWPRGDYKALRAKFGGRHVVRWYGSKGDLGGWEALENQGSPSTDWAVGGPLIERELIGVREPCHPHPSEWSASSEALVRRTAGSGSPQYGPTPLIAAMRAYVASKLGHTVDLP